MSITVLNYTVLSAEPERDVNLPHVCVSENIKNSTITASTTDSSYSTSSLKSPATYGGWKPTSSTSNIVFAFASAASVDYLGLYGDCSGITVTASYSTDGSTYTQIGSAVATEYGSLLFLQDKVDSVTHVKLEFSGGLPVVYTVSSGLSYIMENGLSTGFGPGRLNYEDEYTNTESEGGQILGRAVTRTGVDEDFRISSVTRSWVDSYWLEMRDLLRRNGAFVAWNPGEYQTEVMYGMLTDNPSVSYGDPLYMDINMSFRGPA